MRWICVLPLVLCAVAPARAQVVSGSLNPEDVDFANIPNQQLGPFVFEQVGATHGRSGASGETALTSGLVAIAFDGEVVSLSTTGTLHPAGSTALFVLDETLSVQSASLPAGTPAPTRIRWQLDYDADATHSLGPEIAAAQSGQSSEMSASVRFRAVLPGSGYDQALQSDLHVDVDGSGYATGLFVDPNGVAELVVPTEVGDTIQLTGRVSGSTSVRAPPYFPPVGPTQLPVAGAFGTVAVVFGIESDVAGVTLYSSFLGGPYPDLSNVSLANATAALLPLPLPEPERAASLAAALSALVALGACTRSAKSRRVPCQR